MSEYPEHDKLIAIGGHSQAIGEFLDWLRHDQSVNLMRWEQLDDQLVCPAFRCERGQRIGSNGHPTGDCQKCGGSGFVPNVRETWMHDGRSPEKLLADYFGIDLAKLEQEKRAMLEALRSA